MIKKITQLFNFVNPKLSRVFIPFILKNPKYLKNANKLIKNFDRCETIREKTLKEEGVMIPPILILSITHKCNLNCLGCFASAVGISSTDQSKFHQEALSISEWEGIVSQARKLGVYTFLIAGGEPFVFDGILDLCQKFDDCIFLIFTNGTAIKEADYKQLKKMDNTGIMVSVEGSDQMTDLRRGAGIHEKAIQTAKRLGKSGILSGISVTITNENYLYWMQEEHLDAYINDGLHMGFFTEYIPVGLDSDSSIKKDSVCSTSDQQSSAQKCLTKEQRLDFRQQIIYYKENKQMFIIHSPGDEELFGGCVSAGKGFAHINAFGDLTPCPVSDIATHNLKKSELKDGLSSQLFVQLRENGEILENTDGPCALFEHQKELEDLRKKV
ncbi:MAG: radical SAM/SPASM domain-containing protein, partial [Thermotogota bacterium]